MPKPNRYKIVEEEFLTIMEKVVSHKMEQGWKPLGGVSVRLGKHGNVATYSQAMFKEDIK